MDPLPVAGWYDDGATPGSLRWFDGSTWTESTRPIAPRPSVPATFAAPPSTFGRLPAGRLGQSLNLADHVSEGAAYRRNRLEDALRLRRRGFAQLGGVLVILLLTGAVGIAMHGADTIWYVGVAAAVFLGIRAWRDYQNATFRGAPVLPTSAWVMTGAALAVAIAVLVSGPIVAMTTLAHHLGALGH
jgi:hypothetical protein